MGKSDVSGQLNTLPLTWIDTLKMIRQPQVTQKNVFVSEDEVRQLIAHPAAQDDLALLRDQAAAALLFLSGMRGSAFVTLPISNLDLENLTVRQWPELGVHTKNSKKATTFLLNIPDLLVPVRYWDAIVRPALPPTAPWYAPLEHSWGDQRLSNEEPGKYRLNGLQKRLKLLFSLAKIDFKSPHKFRHGHAVFGLLHAQTMADYKAVSMKLMHESIEITDSTYAPMLPSDVQLRIAGLTRKAMSTPGCEKPLAGDELESFLNKLDWESQKRALVFIAGRLAQ